MLVCSEDEELAIRATKAIHEDLSEYYNQNRDKFKFFGCMKAPLKRLQNKYRYQILMRIDSGEKDMLDDIFYIVNKYNGRTVNVFYEINSNNLS